METAPADGHTAVAPADGTRRGERGNSGCPYPTAWPGQAVGISRPAAALPALRRPTGTLARATPRPPQPRPTALSPALFARGGRRVPDCPSRNRTPRRPPPACQAPRLPQHIAGRQPSAIACLRNDLARRWPVPLFPHRPGVSVRRPAPCLAPILGRPPGFRPASGQQKSSLAAACLAGDRLEGNQIQPRRAAHLEGEPFRLTLTTLLW